MHYVDEDNVQLTESLFVENTTMPTITHNHPHSLIHVSSADSLTSSMKGLSFQETSSPSDKVKVTFEHTVKNSEKEDKACSLTEAEREELGLGVEAELRALLEEKVVKPQRQFERKYQQAHARRHRGAQLTPHTSGSVTPTSGLYRLQVVGFTHDPTPGSASPALSRAGSARNSSLNLTSEPDGATAPEPMPPPPFLVRSVSDASSLAVSLQELRSTRSQTDLRKCLPSKLGAENDIGGGLIGSKRHGGSLQSLSAQPCDK